MPGPFHDKSVTRNNINEIEGVDAFLDTVESLTPLAEAGTRGRLIFALDATASRQSTWDQASHLQSEMFINTRGIGKLDVQLVYYRGFDECRASRWISQSSQLLSLMGKVQCQAGRTQIARILSHALAENRLNPVQALVFVGDCVEEPLDVLADLAGQLKLSGLPVFLFQEGHNPTATAAFREIARVSGGAHCRFDHHSAQQLGSLLNAVATYATGGRKALKALMQSNPASAQLLEQLP